MDQPADDILAFHQCSDAVEAAREAGLRRIAPLPLSSPYQRLVPASGTLVLSEAEYDDAAAYRTILLALETGRSHDEGPG